MKSAMRFFCLTVLLTAFGFLDTASWANNSIPITGSARYEGDNSFSFSFAGSGAGGSVSVSSGTPDAVEIIACQQGLNCTINIPTFDDCDLGFSSGALNSVRSNYLGGGLQFTFVGPVEPDGHFSASVSATLSPSTVQGTYLNPMVSCTPKPLWEIGVRGQGTASLFGLAYQGDDGLLIADFTYIGTATPIPEPSGLAQIGFGLGLVGMLRRKLMR